MTAQHLAGLAHTVASAAHSGTSFTDYLIGWGTAALAAATFVAVFVSIRQESNRRGRETAELDRRWQAQARLVLTNLPGPRRLDDAGSHGLIFRIQNYGEQPVIDAWAEAWAASADLTKPPTLSLHERIVQPGPGEPWILRLPSGPVPLENRILCGELRLLGVHAARTYSLIRPLRTGFGGSDTCRGRLR